MSVVPCTPCAREENARCRIHVIAKSHRNRSRPCRRIQVGNTALRSWRYSCEAADCVSRTSIRPGPAQERAAGPWRSGCGSQEDAVSRVR